MHFGTELLHSLLHAFRNRTIYSENNGTLHKHLTILIKSKLTMVQVHQRGLGFYRFIINIVKYLAFTWHHEYIQFFFIQKTWKENVLKLIL